MYSISDCSGALQTDYYAQVSPQVLHSSLGSYWYRTQEPCMNLVHGCQPLLLTLLITAQGRRGGLLPTQLTT